ncbi:MAG: DEAD/DEAH box helicase [Patescibacteria group bacterium]
MTVKFQDLNLIEPILKALNTEGYEVPTPIQERAIPIILEGQDLLGCAQTGTGKTAAFAIPTLQLLANRKRPEERIRPIRCLVLTPTRELAVQIGESFSAYGRNTGLRHTVVFGGVGQGAQTERLGKGVDILIATPGRLLDLMGQGYIKLQNLEIFILDEADRMLDMGFINDVKKIVGKIPTKRQTLFFSATMPHEIKKLANTLLTDPKLVEVTPVSSTAEKIEQFVYFVSKPDKRILLPELIKEKGSKATLVFTQTKHAADNVVKDLAHAGISALAIHGNKSQNARQRALNGFKNGEITVLVATDIAARGIDVDGLSLVINYNLPNESETYVHRIGRTGRAGASGQSISFCDSEERGYLRDIEKLIAKKITVVTDHKYVDNSPEQKPTPPGRRGRSFPPRDKAQAPAKPPRRSYGEPRSSGGGGYAGHSSKPASKPQHGKPDHRDGAHAPGGRPSAPRPSSGGGRPSGKPSRGGYQSGGQSGGRGGRGR